MELVNENLQAEENYNLIPQETVTKARTLTIPKRGKERVKWLNVHTPRSIPGTSLQAAVCALGGPGWNWLPPRRRWTLPDLSPAQRALTGSQWSGCWCTSSLGHHSFQLREGSQSSTFFLPKSSLAPSTPYHNPDLQTFLSSPPKHYPQGLDFQSQKNNVFATRPERAAPTPGTFTQQPPAMGGSPKANTGELGSGERTLNVNPGSSQGAVQSSAAFGFSAPRSSPAPLRLPSVSQQRKRALFPKDKGTAHNPSPPVLSPPLLCFPGSAKCFCEFLGLQAE